MFEFHTVFQYLIPSPVLFLSPMSCFPSASPSPPACFYGTLVSLFLFFFQSLNSLSLTRSFFPFRHCFVTLLLKKYAFCLPSFQHLLLRVIISSYHSHSLCSLLYCPIISPGLGIILILWCFLF